MTSKPAPTKTEKQAKPAKPIKAGKVQGRPTRRLGTPASGVRRYILTSAQNNTPVYKDCWYNLRAMAEHYDARLMVGRFTYDKSSYGENSVKPGTLKASDFDGLWYDPEVLPFVCDERVELAPGLLWCGELNILPTAVNPLSGLEAYTGRASGIFPHATFAMDSVASGKREATKINYTTGTVTQRNYIQKKAARVLSCLIRLLSGFPAGARAGTGTGCRQRVSAVLTEQ